MDDFMQKKTRFLSFFMCFLSVGVCVNFVGCSGGSKPDAIFEHAAMGSYDAAVTYNGRRAIVSTVNHGILVWDIQHDKQIYRWSQNEGSNEALFARVSFDDRYALTASVKDFVVWSLEDGKAQGFYSISDSEIRDIALSDGGRYVLIGREDGQAEHVDLQTGRRILFLGHTEKINAVALSPNGRYALTGGNDYTAYLWDTQSGQVIYRFTHGRRVILVALEATGKYAFTTDSAKRSVIWDLSTGREHSTLHYFHRHESFSIARFVNDNRWLVTGSPTRALKLWDTATGKLLMKRKITTRADTRPRSAVVYGVGLYNNHIITESSAGFAELWRVDVD